MAVNVSPSLRTRRAQPIKPKLRLSLSNTFSFPPRLFIKPEVIDSFLCHLLFGAMADRSLVRIDRKSSIESEPRTLTISQIRFAREAALYVMSTMKIEQAMRIFTEGLKPVESKKEGRNTAMVGWRGESCYQEQEEEEEEEEPRQLERFRDVLSAPF